MTFEEFSATLGGYSYLELAKLDENELARRRIYDHLLASGVDPGAVLRGEASVATAPEHVLRICKALRNDAEIHGQTARGASWEHHARVQTALLDAATLLEHLAKPSAPPPLTELRELAKRWEERLTGMRDSHDAADQAGFSDETLSAMQANIEGYAQCASELTAALDAMGAKK